MKRMQRVFGDVDSLRFVDDHLDEERRAAFLAHLAEDPAEAERVETWTRQNDALRAAFASVAGEPVPVWLRLGNMMPERGTPRVHEPAEAPLRTAEASVTRLRRRPLTGAGQVGGLLGAVAAAVLIGGLALLLAFDLLPAPRIDWQGRAPAAAAADLGLVNRAADAFRTFALDPVHPVEIPSTQQAQLEHWLQRRISIPIHAPDLRAEGWSLLGGRLAPGDLGPAALFVYENGAGERMAVYVARTGAAPGSAPAIGAIPGGSAMAWVPGPIGVVVTVGKDAVWLAHNGPALKRRIDAADND